MKFSELNINTPLLNALNDMSIDTPTTIQERAFSPIMSGKDLVGVAQTGTGKTIAYLLPALRQWKYDKKKIPQILIIVPTRELVMQVVNVAEQLTSYMNVDIIGIYGGANIKTQSARVYQGCDVLVATPGRLYDIIMLGTLKLKGVKKVVIDEMDEMLNLGFRPQLINILELLPQKRQNLLFSATLTDDVSAFIDDYFNFPVKIEAAPSGTPLQDIEQKLIRVPNHYTKINLLKKLLSDESELARVLVFVATKRLADQLFEVLSPLFKEQVGVIHSNKAQNNRFNTVNKFQNGEFRILIATDIVARGIDISEVSHVINFDVPDVPENYIHRIGRTGRAEKKGNSIVFVKESEEEFLAEVEQLMNKQIDEIPMPEDVEIASELLPEERPDANMKEVFVKIKKKESKGEAFHEKLEKNKKTRIKITRAQQMKMKYKKPKTKGQKRKGRQ